MYGTDLLRCSLEMFFWRTKLRHDFALKLDSRSVGLRGNIGWRSSYPDRFKWSPVVIIIGILFESRELPPHTLLPLFEFWFVFMYDITTKLDIVPCGCLDWPSSHRLRFRPRVLR